MQVLDLCMFNTNAGPSRAILLVQCIFYWHKEREFFLRKLNEPSTIEILGLDGVGHACVDLQA